MKKNSKILIVSHTNIIGKSIIKLLKKQKYTNIHFSKFNSQKIENYKYIKKIFSKIKPEYIFLTDGKSGGILMNQTNPADLMMSNLISSVNIFTLAYQYKVKKLLYISSACVYPKKAKNPLKPISLMSNYLEPTNAAYATAKIAGIELCNAYNKQYGTEYISVIPSNYFGNGDDFSKKNSHVISSLISKIHDAKIKNKKNIVVWGSGKPIRDFIYLDDLADACIHIMKKYKKNIPINISSSNSYSIKKIAYIIKNIVGFKGRIKFDLSKPDGMPMKTLDNTELSKIGWKSSYTFTESLKKTYIWYKDNII